MSIVFTFHFSLQKSPTQPWHFLDVGDEPSADGEDEEQEDDDVVPVTVNAVSEDDVGESVELENGVVRHEKDHGVLSDVVDARHSWQWPFQQETREPQQDNDGVDKGCQFVAVETVGVHDVFSVPHDVQHDKCCNQHRRHDKREVPSHPFYQPPPCAPHVEKEYTHEYVAETHRQRIVQFPHPVAEQGAGEHNNRLEHGYGLDDVYFLDEVY